MNILVKSDHNNEKLYIEEQLRFGGFWSDIVDGDFLFILFCNETKANRMVPSLQTFRLSTSYSTSD